MSSQMSEISRINAEYERRATEVDADLYAPWQPGEILMTSERRRVAAQMLHKINKFPVAGDRCLEVGFGKIGWLADLISWGVRESDLYGIELSETRAAYAIESLPGAHLEIGSATKLSWADNYFDLVIASTVFSSVLDGSMRTSIAQEMNRVLKPQGVVLWYDLAMDNPRNKNIRRIDRTELQELFPNFVCQIRSVTLAPPISRKVAKYSWTIATALSVLPFLRTHYLATLVKRQTT